MKRIGILIVALMVASAGPALAGEDAGCATSVKAFRVVGPLGVDCSVSVTVPENVVDVERLTSTLAGVGELIESEAFVIVSEAPVLEATVAVGEKGRCGARVIGTVISALAKAALKGVAFIINAVI